MSKLRVESFTVSIDGFGAGPNQNLENPLGVGGEALHKWFIPTRTFQEMHIQTSPETPGKAGGTTGIDDDFASRGFRNVGAWILGRNMFGPIRGAWPDSNWKGWWGDTPPYHVPVFVLTHHPRESFTMNGGTTFHFITEGIHKALERAVKAANGLDVRVGGGVHTIRQYLAAGLIDEMHIAVSPVLLGSGENMFHDINMLSLGYTIREHVASENATHIVFKKR